MRKRAINKESVGILKTHVEYIREAIDKLDGQLSSHIKWGDKRMEQIDKNFKNMDDRIQKLEGWVGECEKSQEKGFKNKSLRIAFVGLVVSSLLNIIAIILNLMGYL